MKRIPFSKHIHQEAQWMGNGSWGNLFHNISLGPGVGQLCAVRKHSEHSYTRGAIPSQSSCRPTAAPEGRGYLARSSVVSDGISPH